MSKSAALPSGSILLQTSSTEFIRIFLKSSLLVLTVFYLQLFRIVLFWIIPPFCYEHIFLYCLHIWFSQKITGKEKSHLPPVTLTLRWLKFQKGHILCASTGGDRRMFSFKIKTTDATLVEKLSAHLLMSPLSSSCSDQCCQPWLFHEVGLSGAGGDVERLTLGWMESQKYHRSRRRLKGGNNRFFVLFVTPAPRENLARIS